MQNPSFWDRAAASSGKAQAAASSGNQEVCSASSPRRQPLPEASLCLSSPHFPSAVVASLPGAVCCRGPGSPAGASVSLLLWVPLVGCSPSQGQWWAARVTFRSVRQGCSELRSRLRAFQLPPPSFQADCPTPAHTRWPRHHLLQQPEALPRTLCPQALPLRQG